MPPNTPPQQGSGSLVTTPPKAHWFVWVKAKPALTISVLVLIMVGYYFVYHSNTYLKTFSHKIGGATGDGFYEVNYPTHKGFFYFRHWQGGEWPFQTFKMQIAFVRGADSKTFKPLGQLYAIDKNTLYFAWASSRQIVKVPDADLSSVVLLDDYYVKDSTSVFYADKKLSEAAASDFRFLNKEGNPRYGLSSGRIYYGADVIHAVRDGTFVMSIQHQHIPCRNQKPSQAGYYVCDLTESGEDIEVPIDTATFQILDHKYSDIHTYAKDNKYAYFIDTLDCKREVCSRLHVIEGADPKTFRVEPVEGGWHGAFDANAVYADGCKLYGVSAANPMGAVHQGERDKYSVRRGEGHHIDQGRCTYY
ncbi:MAG TPA: DKNYY domain-containing protein [Candidatus Paceibacterota bacterium]